MDLQASKFQRSFLKFTDIQEIDDIQPLKELRNLRAVEMVGNSMCPVIPPKTILLITNDFEFSAGNIYICLIKTDFTEEVWVKRVFRADYNNIVLKSYDNLLNEDIFIPVAEMGDVLLAEVKYVIKKPY